MSKSKIEWTEQTWNLIVGCSKVSPGCANCYAERMACRIASMEQRKWDDEHDGEPSLSDNSHVGPYDTVTDLSVRKWNGRTEFVYSALNKPLKRKKATTYFVCSMSDLFHESVPFEWIDKVFAVMRQAGQHTFQLLTKRPERMAEYLSPDNDRYTASKVADLLPHDYPGTFDVDMYWPLDNVWLGTTAENQEMANKRIPELLKCPAAKRFVSVEPMLGAVDLNMCPIIDEIQLDDEGDNEDSPVGCIECRTGKHWEYMSEKHKCGLDWVICGGESGPGARPMHPDWARSIRDQCKAAGVPFFFKQWGEWYHEKGERFGYAFDPRSRDPKPETYGWWNDKGEFVTGDFGNDVMWRVGKKKVGSLLDGVEHKEYPK